MWKSRVHRWTFVVIAILGSLAITAAAQPGPENNRCLTRDQLNIEPIFSACPPLVDQASVSDNSFIARLYFYNGPSRYTMRWRGQGYFNEDVFTYNEETGLYDGFCATRACSIGHGGWVQMEHWDYFVGTLLAENVGTWTYEELHDDVVFQSRTFEVRELNLSAVSGDGQMGIVDQNLPRPLALKLESFEGIGIEDEVIGWSIEGPKGAKRAAVYGIGSSSETDADGLDAATVHLGSKPGAYTVTLSNRRVTTESQPSFTFTAIDDIEDTHPEPDHPETEEGVGQNRAQQCDSVGNPVTLSIGNKFQREVDLAPTGLSPVEFVRYHNSLGFISNSFGGYWTHTYDRLVEIPGDPYSQPVKVVRPDGKKINFSWNGSAYRAAPGVYSTLEKTAAGWRFVDEDQTIENYDTSGLLADITDLRGRSQTATHDAHDRLIRIEANTGGGLAFGYDGDGRLATVTDPSGRTWTYRYEILGRLAFVDNPDGTTREYHYEDLRHAHALTGITQENGQRFAWYEYDDLGRAIASWHADGSDRVDIQYQENGERIVLDPMGNATLYKTHIEHRRGLLDAINGPICSQGCGLTDTQYAYDADLNVIARTIHGVTTRYGDYDAGGQPGYVIQAAGTADEKRIDYEYAPGFRNRITRIIEPSVYPGETKITSREYDEHGNLVREDIDGFDPYGRAVSRSIAHVYDGPFGQISATDGPRTDVDDVTTYEYYPDTPEADANRARLRAVVEPGGIRVRDEIVYSATGKVLSEGRPNGVTVVYEYDPGNDRLKSLTEMAGAAFERTDWTYFPNGDVHRIIVSDETGDDLITQFTYDNARRLTRVEWRASGGSSSATDQWVSYEFDAAGNVVSEVRGSKDMPGQDFAIERLFDAFGRLDTLTRGGVTEDFDYNPDGTLAAHIDGNQNTTNYTYDAFKRLTSTREAGQMTTSISYDTNGNQLTVTDPEGHSTEYLYDDLGNRVRRNSPDSGVTTFSYNGAGQVSAQVDANGQSSVFTYDANGRLAHIDRAGLDYDVNYTFDDCSNGVGRLCEITTGWGHTIRYGWNALGELISIDSNEGRVEYAHGPRHSVSSIQYPSGRVVSFDVGVGGRPQQIRLRNADGTDSILVDDIGYSPLGRPVSWRFANGLQTSFDFDPRQRPTAIDVAGLWSWRANAYDANDNLLDLNAGAETLSFAYDALDRLVHAASDAWNIGFVYDKVGNRLSTTFDGVAELADYEAGSNRLASYGNRQFLLDPNGSTVSVSTNEGPAVSYHYSSHNRLTEVVDEAVGSSLASYRYDALGQRVEKVTSALIRKFVYGLDGELLAELDGNGKVLHEYVYLAGQPVIDLFEVSESMPPTTSSGIIIDDLEASVYGRNWQSKSSSAAINGTYLQNRKRDNRGVYWYVDQPGFAGGSYDVYVKWLQPGGEGYRTRYGVKVAGENSHRVTIEHEAQDFGDWVLLGNFEFAPAGSSPSQYISLTGFDNPYGYEGTFLEADAVMLTPTFLPPGRSELKFIHGDHLGTPQFVTDESGQVVWSASHLPFGRATVNEDPDGDGITYTLNLRFPGQYYDEESELHYNYLRDFDPAIGRYLEVDPIGLSGGLNTFAYAESNPLRFSDVFGLDTEFCRRPFYPTPIPYARHCFVRYTNGGSSSFGPSGTGPDPAPEWWPRSCQATQGKQDDDCMRREMNTCEAEQYDFMGFNCCHCVDRAMRLCGIGIPRHDWPNWPVNPGPQAGEPGYSPDPRATRWNP